VKVLINIDVPKLGPAIEFYRNALGLRCTRVIDGDVAELAGAGSVLYLLEKPPESSSATEVEGRRYERHWTPVHVDFVVDDVERAAERAVAAGARRESECIEWMGSKCITLSDPFGHGFCVIELEHGTYGHRT
jgi:uncharacterized glyoxalase superfamily protein PhnB